MKMSWWTLVPKEEERKSRQSKILDQIRKPNPTSDRVRNYPYIHGFKTKKEAIIHLNKMGVPNDTRPEGFKSYDLRK